MLKNSVSLAPDTNGLKSIGQSGEVRYLHPGDIFETTRSVKIVRNPYVSGPICPARLPMYGSNRCHWRGIPSLVSKVYRELTWRRIPSSTGRDGLHLFRQTMTARRNKLKPYSKVSAIQSLILETFAMEG